MKKFILGVLVGLICSGAVTLASGPVMSDLARAQQIQNDVTNRMQAQMGQMMMTVFTLQAQLSDAQSRASACEDKLKAHK